MQGLVTIKGKHGSCRDRRCPLRTISYQPVLLRDTYHIAQQFFTISQLGCATFPVFFSIAHFCGEGYKGCSWNECNVIDEHACALGSQAMGCQSCNMTRLATRDELHVGPGIP